MWNDILQWVSVNAGLVSLSAILVLCFIMIFGAVVYDRRASIKAYLAHRQSIRVQRGLVMGRKKQNDRKAYLKGRWSDGLTEFGEKEWLEGRMTREEVNAGYRMFGKTHNMPDLLPHMTPAQVKSAIKGRKARGVNTPAQEHPSWGASPAAPAKAAAPAASDTTNVVQAAKRFGQKFMDKVKVQKTA